MSKTQAPIDNSDTESDTSSNVSGDCDLESVPESCEIVEAIAVLNRNVRRIAYMAGPAAFALNPWKRIRPSLFSRMKNKIQEIIVKSGIDAITEKEMDLPGMALFEATQKNLGAAYARHKDQVNSTFIKRFRDFRSRLVCFARSLYLGLDDSLNHTNDVRARAGKEAITHSHPLFVSIITRNVFHFVY